MADLSLPTVTGSSGFGGARIVLAPIRGRGQGDDDPLATLRAQLLQEQLRRSREESNIDFSRLTLAAQGQADERRYRTGVLGETQSHNVAEEKHWADLLGLDQQKLKETAREHDSALGELGDYHKGVLRNQLTEGFMAHLAPLYANNPEIIQNVLKNRGLPELSAAAQMLVEKQNKTIADTTLANYNLAKTSGKGDPNALLTDLQTRNPDAYELIKNKVDAKQTSTTTKGVGYNLGKLLSALSIPLDPNKATNLGLKVYPKVKQSFLGDFVRAVSE